MIVKKCCALPRGGKWKPRLQKFRRVLANGKHVLTNPASDDERILRRVTKHSQDFNIPQTAFLYNYSLQTIGKLALFEKYCHNGKEEARTGWSNVDRVPQSTKDRMQIM